MAARSQRAQADVVKAEGNKCYAKGKYAAAAEKYTEAICMCPDVAIYYSNRGLCHKQRKLWQPMLRDAVRALELDDKLYKAHMLRGEALCAMHKWEGGIKSLHRAVDVATRLHASQRVIDSLQSVLERHLKDEDEFKSVEAESKDAQMLSFITDALDAYVEKRTAEITGEMTGAGRSEADIGEAVNRFKESAGEHASRFKGMVAEEHAKRMDREPPEHLVGPISFELFRDPVVTPSGHVYERRCITEYLRRSATDPLTREPLRVDQLYPCHPIRQAAQAFLKENPWAGGFDTA